MLGSVSSPTDSDGNSVCNEWSPILGPTEASATQPQRSAIVNFIVKSREHHTLVEDALEGHTSTLLVKFFRKGRCVVLSTGVRVGSDV